MLTLRETSLLCRNSTELNDYHINRHQLFTRNNSIAIAKGQISSFVVILPEILICRNQYIIEFLLVENALFNGHEGLISPLGNGNRFIPREKLMSIDMLIIQFS